MELSKYKTVEQLAAPMRTLIRSPYWANAKEHGAIADGIKVTDGAITASDNTLTSATGSFASGDVGKLIVVYGAAASADDLTTTIASFTSATEVELTDAAGTTVSNATVIWGTDNSSALQATIDASDNIYIPAGIYVYDTELNLPGSGQEGYTMIGDGMQVSWLVYLGTGKGLDNPSPSGASFRYKLADFSIWGTTDGTDGIEFDQTYNSEITRVECSYFGSDGFYIRRSHTVELTNCYASYNGAAGCRFGMSQNQSTWRGGQSVFNDVGVEIDKEATAGGLVGLKVRDATITNNVTYGVVVDQGRKCIISGNHFEKASGTSGDYHIYISSDDTGEVSQSVIVKENNLFTTGPGSNVLGIYVDRADYTEIHDNYSEGYYSPDTICTITANAQYTRIYGNEWQNTGITFSDSGGDTQYLERMDQVDGKWYVNDGDENVWAINTGASAGYITGHLFKRHTGYSYSHYVNDTGACETTDDTATTVWQLNLPDNSVWHFDILVSARRTDSGTENGVYWRRYGVYRQAAGNATQIAAAQTPAADMETTMSGTITCGVVSTYVRVQVTGQADKTIAWTAAVRFHGVNDTT